MDGFAQDLRYGWRALRARPGFTMVAVSTLALGIAVNTTMFSVVSGVLLAELPYREPERLALIRVMSDGQTSLPSLSPPEVEDLRERAGVFEDVASVRDNTGTLTGVGRAGAAPDRRHPLELPARPGRRAPDRPRFHGAGRLSERRAGAAARSRPLAGPLRRRPRDRGTLDRPRRPVHPGRGGPAREPRAPAPPRGRPAEAARRLAALRVRLPHRAPIPLDAGARAPLSRRQPAAGPGRHRPPRAAAHLGDPGLQDAAVPPPGASAARRPREPRAPDGARPVRGGRLRAADRLRQRGEPASRPGRRARARAGRPRPRSAPAGPASCASSSPKACCSPSRGPPSASCSRRG